MDNIFWLILLAILPLSLFFAIVAARSRAADAFDITAIIITPILASHITPAGQPHIGQLARVITDRLGRHWPLMGHAD